MKYITLLVQVAPKVQLMHQISSSHIYQEGIYVVLEQPLMMNILNYLKKKRL